MAEIDKEFPLPDVNYFVDHIDYIVNLVGVNYVGISSDFGGGGGINGWMDASQTNNITSALIERGYSNDDIKKIWSENLFRVRSSVESYSIKNSMQNPSG